MTYKELSEKTKIPNSRKKVLTVMRWLKKNVTKKEIEKRFDETYGYLISSYLYVYDKNILQCYVVSF